MELNSGESVYLEGGAVYIKKSFGVFQGTMYITNNRIVFCKRSGLLNALLGPLLMHITKGKKIVFEIPLEKLSKIGIEKHGFAKKYVFYNSNGDFEYIQFNTNAGKWIDAIKSAVQTNVPNVQISQIGELVEFKY
jgi:hypothetical protein